MASNLNWESPNQENWTNVSEFPFLLEIFHSDEPKRRVSFPSNRNFFFFFFFFLNWQAGVCLVMEIGLLIMLIFRSPLCLLIREF